MSVADADDRPVILVVEDNERALRLRTEALTAAGCTTIGVQSHLDAVRELESTDRIDLVLTDIHLSSAPDDKSGVDLARYIKRSYGGLPVAGYSAVFFDQELAEVRQVFDVCWPKGHADIDAVIDDCRERATSHKVAEANSERAKAVGAASGAPRDQLKVFLCHASEDKLTVRAWADSLRDRDYDVWLDSLRLLPGDDWEHEIRAAVELTDVVVVALSARSINKVGFIQKEIKLVLDAADERPEGRTFVIPARLDATPVPARLRRWHWIDARDEFWLDRLDSALRKVRKR